MNKETIKGSLLLFQDFSRWLYCEPTSYENFKKEFPREMDGISFTIGQDDNGLFEITVKGEESVKYAVFTQNLPALSTGQNDQLYYGYQFASPVPEGKEEFYKRAAIFIFSAFQRKQAFVFFSRMAPESIEIFANTLSQRKELDESAKADKVG